MQETIIIITIARLAERDQKLYGTDLTVEMLQQEIIDLEELDLNNNYYQC